MDYVITKTKSLILASAALIGAASSAIATQPDRQFGVWTELEHWHVLDDADLDQSPSFGIKPDSKSFVTNGFGGFFEIICSTKNGYRLSLYGPFKNQPDPAHFPVGPIDVQLEFSPGKYLIDFHATSTDDAGGSIEIPLNAKQVEGLHYSWNGILIRTEGRPFLYMPADGISKAMEALDDDCSGRAKSRLPVRPFG